MATDAVRQYKKYILDFMHILKLFDSITDQWVIDKEPPHTCRFFVRRQKIVTCRLVCSEFRQVCDKIGACRAISAVLDLETSCRPCRLVCAGPKQFVGVGRNCHGSHVNKPLFKHGGDRLCPKTKRG